MTVYPDDDPAFEVLPTVFTARFSSQCQSCGELFVVGVDQIFVLPDVVGPQGGALYAHTSCLANPGFIVVLIARFRNQCSRCPNRFVVGVDAVFAVPGEVGPRGGVVYAHVTCPTDPPSTGPALVKQPKTAM